LFDLNSTITNLIYYRIDVEGDQEDYHKSQKERDVGQNEDVEGSSSLGCIVVDHINAVKE
jgi:hypothetical protein